MADVLNRTTKEILYSVNTPDFDPLVWIINPDLTLLETVPIKYCNIVGDVLVEMTPAEKAVVDAAELAAYKIQKTTEVSIVRESKIQSGPGVEYPSGSGQFLSCSDGDQGRWLGWQQIGGKWNALGLSFPFRVHSRDGSTYVDVTKAQDFTAVLEAMWKHITDLFSEAETVIQNLLAAPTIQAVDNATQAYLASDPLLGNNP